MAEYFSSAFDFHSLQKTDFNADFNFQQVENSRRETMLGVKDAPLTDSRD